MAAGRELQAEERHRELLAVADGEDFADLDKLGFLQTGLEDKQGRQVVLVIAKLYPAKVLQRDRVLRYFCRKVHAVAEAPYSLVWLHSTATYWENCPSALWMWRTWDSLPAHYRTNLVAMHVLHCDLNLWTAAVCLGPWLSGGLWRKVNWVSRVEFLWDVVDKAALLPRLPEFVCEHDGVLEEQPLADYGIVAQTGLTAGLPGGVAPPL
ncbi:Sec14p-like lipid-binding protein [Haematococcus lacustris]